MLRTELKLEVLEILFDLLDGDRVVFTIQLVEVDRLRSVMHGFLGPLFLARNHLLVGRKEFVIVLLLGHGVLAAVKGLAIELVVEWGVAHVAIVGQAGRRGKRFTVVGIDRRGGIRRTYRILASPKDKRCSRMHFLLTAIGSYGDVHPMVGLGTALASRGHRVQIVANPYFADDLARADLELIPVSTAEHYREMIASPDIWRPTKALQFIVRLAVVDLLRPLYETIERHYVEGETVVAAHALDASSRVFRDKTGARVATVTFSPQALWSWVEAPEMGAVPIGPRWPRWWNNTLFRLGSLAVGDPVLRWPLNRFRRDLGLPPIGRLFPDWWFASDSNVCLFPDWFAPLQPDWPQPIELVGFPLWDAGDRTPLPAELESFLAAGDAPLVFAPGTANVQAASFFQTAVDVCRSLDRRGVLLTKFAEQVPRDLPDSVRHYSFVPLTRLLPRTAAFVHHGGIGSSSQGLAAGVPQLIRPLAFDQFDNSARLCRLGVAEQLLPKRFDVDRAGAALERLTSFDAVGQSCEQLAARCDGAASIARACDLLEAVATR